MLMFFNGLSASPSYQNVSYVLVGGTCLWVPFAGQQKHRLGPRSCRTLCRCGCASDRCRETSAPAYLRGTSETQHTLQPTSSCRRLLQPKTTAHHKIVNSTCDLAGDVASAFGSAMSRTLTVAHSPMTESSQHLHRGRDPCAEGGGPAPPQRSPRSDLRRRLIACTARS